jgi:hypothetical protein
MFSPFVFAFEVNESASYLSETEMEQEFHQKKAFIEDSNGCEYQGSFVRVGTIKAMNKKELNAYKQATGYRAHDSFAVLMQCLYLVNPKASDHPEPSKRKYVWVAS